MFLGMESISPHDWLSLVHPVIMILFVYPVFGATVRLGILAREKRLDLNPIADTAVSYTHLTLPTILRV